MNTRYVLLAILVSVAFSSEYFRVPLTKGYFYDLTVDIGTPPQKMNVAVSLVFNKFVAYCEGKDSQQYYDPSKSSSMSKVYCNSSDFNCSNACPVSNEKEQCVSELDVEHQKQKVYEDVVKIDTDGVEIEGKIICSSLFDDQIKMGMNISERGMLGLGPLTKGSPITRWFAASEKRKKFMSLCMTKTGGYLQLGVDSSIKQAKGVSLTFSPVLTGYGTMDMQQIMYGDQVLFSLGAPQEGGEPNILPLMFGSINENISLFPEDVSKQITKEIVTKCQLDENCKPSRGMKGCITFKDNSNFEKQLDLNFPILSLKMNGHMFTWIPSQYFYQSRGELCPCLMGSPDKVILLGERLLWNKNIIIDFDKTKFEIYENQKCDLAASKSDGKDNKEEHRYQKDEEQRQKQKLPHEKDQEGSHNQKPKENQHQGKNDEKSKQNHHKDKQNGDKSGEISKQTDADESSSSLKYIFLVILLILVVLLCYFWKTIKRFFQGQINKLKNIQSNQLQEQGVDGSEMSVK